MLSQGHNLVTYYVVSSYLDGTYYLVSSYLDGKQN
jgi:hypothetical protein